MFPVFFKKKFEYSDAETSGIKTAKKKGILIIVIIAGILFLAFGKTDTAVVNEKAVKSTTDSYDTSQYIAENEQRLKEILETVQGAGKVKAMITISEIGEKVIASNKKTENISENNDNKSSHKSNSEQSAILYGSGSEEKPFVLKEKLPVPSGVLIVATGAGDEHVRLEIYEAVKALYGISGHRIKVTSGIVK